MTPKRLKPLFWIFGLLLLGGCLSPSRKAESAPSPAQLATILRRLFPDSEPEAVAEAAALPGGYKNHSLGGIAEVYLYPDQTYSWIQYSDVGTSYDEGRWSFAGGLATLVSSGIAGTTPGKTIRLNAVALTTGEKREQYLVQGDPTEWGSGDDARHFLFLMVTLAKNRELNAGEIAPLKIRFNAQYVTRSLDEVLSRFRPLSGGIRINADGTFLLEAPGPDDRQADNILDFGKNDGTGLVEIAIAGVKLRATRIEISRDMNNVRLTGSTEIVGGKLPDAPWISLFIEGKQVLPVVAP